MCIYRYIFIFLFLIENRNSGIEQPGSIENTERKVDPEKGDPVLCSLELECVEFNSVEEWEAGDRTG